jgi:hypothetical protein
VEHVAFHELVPRVQQDLLAASSGASMSSPSAS